MPRLVLIDGGPKIEEPLAATEALAASDVIDDQTKNQSQIYFRIVAGDGPRLKNSVAMQHGDESASV